MKKCSFDMVPHEITTENKYLCNIHIGQIKLVAFFSHTWQLTELPEDQEISHG